MNNSQLVLAFWTNRIVEQNLNNTVIDNHPRNITWLGSRNTLPRAIEGIASQIA
jgi:hypothetical protein